MNEHTGNLSEKTSEEELEKECCFKKKKSMFGEIIVLLALIHIHVSHLSLPYLVIQYQNRVCHVFNLLSLTWDPRSDDA